jgi:hypothetical protein
MACGLQTDSLAEDTILIPGGCPIALAGEAPNRIKLSFGQKIIMAVVLL